MGESESVSECMGRAKRSRFGANSSKYIFGGSPLSQNSKHIPIPSLSLFSGGEKRDGMSRISRLQISHSLQRSEIVVTVSNMYKGELENHLALIKRNYGILQMLFPNRPADDVFNLVLAKTVACVALQLS